MSRRSTVTTCAEPGCPADADGAETYCPKHRRPPWRNSTRGQRLPADWRARRAIVMRRDKGICHVCKGPGADAVDHVVQGDDHRLSNLAPIHEDGPPYCHRGKSSREGAAARRARRPGGS